MKYYYNSPSTAIDANVSSDAANKSINMIKIQDKITMNTSTDTKFPLKLKTQY